MAARQAPDNRASAAATPRQDRWPHADAYRPTEPGLLLAHMFFIGDAQRVPFAFINYQFEHDGYI